MRNIKVRAKIRLFDSVEKDMRERDAARAAQTKVGRGDWIPRPTKAEVLADVPGARNVKPELLPEGVQHLSNVSAGVVARDPNVAVGVIVEGLATDPKEVGRQKSFPNEEKPTL